MHRAEQDDVHRSAGVEEGQLFGRRLPGRRHLRRVRPVHGAVGDAVADRQPPVSLGLPDGARRALDAADQHYATFSKAASWWRCLNWTASISKRPAITTFPCRSLMLATWSPSATSDRKSTRLNSSH